MSLRDKIVAAIDAWSETDNENWMDEAADAIIALVLAHATSDEAVGRAKEGYAYGIQMSIPGTHEKGLRAAILAALEGDQ